MGGGGGNAPSTDQNPMENPEKCVKGMHSNSKIILILAKWSKTIH